MPNIEIRRGPLKGNSFEIARSGAGIDVIHSRQQRDGTEEIRWGISAGKYRDGLEFVLGKGDPGGYDREHIPDESVYIHPLGLRIIRNATPNLSEYRIDIPDYISSKRMITGKIEPLTADVLVQYPTGIKTVSKGTSAFYIGYMPKRRSKSESGFANDFLSSHQAMAEGLSEYLEFLTSLQFDPKFQDVELVRGGTHPRMARLAINRLGFYPLVGESAKTDPNDPNSHRNIVHVAGLKEDLISQRARIYRFYELLTNPKSHPPKDQR